MVIALPSLKLTVKHETWPLAEAFTISRGAKTAAEVVIASISDGVFTGHGECVPYQRYGETISQVLQTIEAVAQNDIPDKQALQQLLPAGAARNAIDCALWDYEAKRQRTTVACLAGLPTPATLLTAHTISLAEPAAMATRAKALSAYPLLKLKLGGPGDAQRMQLVRAARPDARIIVDANEGWPAHELPQLLNSANEARIELIEQPLPADSDQALAHIDHVVPICADESVHLNEELASLCNRYDAVNIKLDKTGGLTHALALHKTARDLGLKVMIGCMVATSLAMAPAMLIAANADWVDLDGPLLLLKDRPHNLIYEGASLAPAATSLWG